MMNVILRHEDKTIAGVCNKTKKYWYDASSELNNLDFKNLFPNVIYQEQIIEPNYQMIFDKSIKEPMFSEHISYKPPKNIYVIYMNPGSFKVQAKMQVL